MTIRLTRTSSIEEVRAIIAAAAREWSLQVLEKPVANCVDLIGNPHDSVVALPDIEMVMNDEVRIRSGYDNGFVPANAALMLQQYMMEQQRRSAVHRVFGSLHVQEIHVPDVLPEDLRNQVLEFTPPVVAAFLQRPGCVSSVAARRAFERDVRRVHDKHTHLRAGNAF